jgi:hypothetical protein
MNYGLATMTSAHEPNPSFQYDGDSFGRIASRPEHGSSSEPPLDRSRQQGGPPAHAQFVEQVFSIALRHLTSTLRHALLRRANNVRPPALG